MHQNIQSNNTQKRSAPLELHNQLTTLVKTERKIIHEVLRCIYLIDKTKAFAELGYSSLFDYLVHGQRYSETSALNRIDGMRLLKEIPEVATKLQNGVLNLSQLHKLKVAINQEQKVTGSKIPITKKQDILNKMENRTLKETEKVLIEELNYEPTIKEKVQERSEDVYLTIKLSKNQFIKLKKAQSLLSHVNIDNAYSSLLESMSEFVINKKLGKKEVGLPSPQKPSIPNDSSKTMPQKTNIKTEKVLTPSYKLKRKFISGSTKKALYQKAEHSCEFISPITGKRCSSTFQLQVDHKTPLAKGGAQNAENLRLLCRTHNLSEARRWGLWSQQKIGKISLKVKR